MPYVHNRAIADGAPAVAFTAVVSGVAFPVCRALLVATAGTADLTDETGVVTAGLPLQAGYNPLSCVKVTLGTAVGVWALY